MGKIEKSEQKRNLEYAVSKSGLLCIKFYTFARKTPDFSR